MQPYLVLSYLIPTVTIQNLQRSPSSKIQNKQGLKDQCTVGIAIKLYGTLVPNSTTRWLFGFTFCHQVAQHEKVILRLQALNQNEMLWDQSTYISQSLIYVSSQRKNQQEKSWQSAPSNYTEQSMIEYKMKWTRFTFKNHQKSRLDHRCQKISHLINLGKNLLEVVGSLPNMKIHLGIN